MNKKDLPTIAMVLILLAVCFITGYVCGGVVDITPAIICGLVFCALTLIVSIVRMFYKHQFVEYMLVLFSWMIFNCASLGFGLYFGGALL